MKLFLHNNRSLLFTNETYVVCNDPLEIEITGDVENVYGVCSIDKKRTTIKVKDGKLSIPPDFLEEGELHLSLQRVENGEVTCKWKTERVILKSLNGGYEAVPEIESLRVELSTLKQALKELYGIINKNNQI